MHRRRRVIFFILFVSDFIGRHTGVLKKKEGKVTSPKRCIEAVQKIRKT